jgi:hypothetical protein
VYGEITSAKGSRDFFSKLCVVGTVFRVERTNLGGQFANGDGVTLVFGGRWIGGGGRSSSDTWKGWFIKSDG